MQISKQKATIIFVDFSKAFDSVNRKVMFQILDNYGIPSQIIKAISIMYNHSTSFVQSMDGPTKEFKTTSGILQGDTFAPYLFVIAVDYILLQSVENMKEKGLDVKPDRTSRDKGKYLADLDYADDIALIAKHIRNAQDLLSSVENASAKLVCFLTQRKLST